MHLWLQKHREAVLVGLVQNLAFGILLGLVIIFLRRPIPAAIVISPLETPAPLAALPTATPLPVLVYILGSVERPGVYELPWDSRIRDAVSLAGGLSPNADPAGINLAERVHDGQQLFVPALGQVPPALPTPVVAQLAPGAPSSSAAININTADAATLATLPGIGPVIAQRVIDYRQQNGPFVRVEDITRVKGIGDVILAKVRDLVTVR